MTPVAFPAGCRRETLERRHRRKAFDCGEATVNDWLRARALQNQDKHLSTTKVWLKTDDAIAGYDTLATGQVEFGDLPAELVRRLPRRALPVAILAWLGVDHRDQTLRDGHTAGQTLAFLAVILDCLSDRAKAFDQRWDFRELPGHPYRLSLSADQLSLLMDS